MEVFWTILIFLFLLAYTLGYLRLSKKLSSIAERDSGLEHRTGYTRQQTFTISRMTMQRLLGAIWLVDGLFQLKPQMFTPAFLQQVVLPTSEGQPNWAAAMITWGANMEMAHIVFWNTLFALIQVALGVALILNFKAKQTILISLAWSLFVWVFGEGLGQIMTGQSLLINGAPGAVLIYGLLGIAVYPGRETDYRGWTGFGTRFAQVSFGLLLIAGAALHFQRMYLTPTGLSQAVALPWLARAIGTGGIPVSLLLAAMELSLGLMVLFQFGLRMATWTSVILFFLYWWMGQSFGQIAQPLATDFNSGLLMIFLAIACQPELISWRVIQPLQHRTIPSGEPGNR